MDFKRIDGKLRDSKTLESIKERARFAREQAQKFLDGREERPGTLVEERFEIRELNVDNLKSEIEELKKDLRAISEDYREEDAALLLYSHINKVMVEKKNEYEELSVRADQQKSQIAEGQITEISHLLDISSQLRGDYSLQKASPDRELVLLDKRSSLKPAKGGESEEFTEKCLKKELERMHETSEMLRRYVDQQSSVN